VRAIINVTSLEYSPELADQSSDEFVLLARRVGGAIESEYLTVPGQQTVNVLQFRYVMLSTLHQKTQCHVLVKNKIKKTFKNVE